MRKLLLFFAMLCVSIGAWAVSVSTSDGICTITNDQAGNLASYAFSADDKAATKVIVSGPVSTADLNHLSELASAVTLDLDGCEASDDVSGFTVASSVDFVSLPGGLNREQVKAFGEANTGIKSAYSAFPHLNKVDRSTSENVDEFVCYVREGGSLRSCINATNDNAVEFVKNAKYLTIIGNAMPLDYASGNPYIGIENTLTSDNHVSVSATVSSSNNNTNVVFAGVGTKTLWSDVNAITFFEAGIVSLDMRDMRLSGPNMEADLTLPMLGYKADKLKYVVLPIGDPNFKTLPAGCIGNLQSMLSINIPSTVKVLKSGSLFGSAMLCHVWTDGTDADKRYDYGAVLSVAADGTETKVYADDIVDQSPVYGTWTLPASLTYIETILTNAEHVKDLYVMATKAPVCEVDAFGSRMYLANNGYTVPTDQKIIDRDYYYNNTSGAPYAWTTMLHYPTGTVAPDLQRYTDPTREYTAATGLKDDKGNTIYLPTQNEWNRAYWQGTTGYVWKAWKTERDENATIYIPGTVSFGYSNAMQSSANGAYDASWDADSYLSSFYDVTDGGSLTKPSTLENYYNVYWNESQYKLNNTGAGVKLYPEAETEGTGTYVDQPVYENGQLVYIVAEPQTEGTHVKETNYVENPEGPLVLNYYEDEGGSLVADIDYVAKTDGSLVKDLSYDEDNTNGTLAKDYTMSEFEGTPNSGDTYYYHPYTVYNWNKDPRPTLYYLKQEYGRVTNGGTFTHVKTSWGSYETLETVRGWEWTEEQIAAAEHYNLVEKYEIWNNSPQGVTTYELSEDFKEWTSNVSGVTIYTKTYNTPVAYHTFDSSVDYTLAADGTTVYEPKYKETDNGYRNYDSTTDEGLTRYELTYTGTFHTYDASIDGEDVTLYTLGDGYRTAVTSSELDEALQHYSISYTYRAYNESTDAGETLYKVKTESVEVMNVTNTNDYRGWHQFVLTSYSAFDKVPTIYEKMYTSDTDWWTICLPYDLTYSETMRYFSDGSTVPVVSKLQYVKRDAENKQITLCFTKNLMKNKEDFTNGGSLAGVHGDLDDNGVLKIQVGTAPAADDVVLHAGVAYLIKPTLPASASHTQQIKWTEEITGQALSAEEEADNALYSKITAAQKNESNWGDLVKNAIYTVPAFDIVSDGSLTVDGVKCQKSADYTYSFVGSLFKSPMPTNCYFLGWDSTKNKAAFWYNKYSDPSDWNWGNMTGIICPNLTEGVSVTSAEGLRVAARWVLEGETVDDTMVGTSAKRMPAMLFEVDAPEGSAVTGISEIQKSETEGKTIYNLNGVRVSGSQNSLAKGVYIVNGKKVVVK